MPRPHFRHSREGGNLDPTSAASYCLIEIPAFAGMTERAGMSREFFHTLLRGNDGKGERGSDEIPIVEAYARAVFAASRFDNRAMTKGGRKRSLPGRPGAPAGVRESAFDGAPGGRRFRR